MAQQFRALATPPEDLYPHWAAHGSSSRVIHTSLPEAPKHMWQTQTLMKTQYPKINKILEKDDRGGGRRGGNGHSNQGNHSALSTKGPCKEPQLSSQHPYCSSEHKPTLSVISTSGSDDVSQLMTVGQLTSVHETHTIRLEWQSTHLASLTLSILNNATKSQIAQTFSAKWEDTN